MSNRDNCGRMLPLSLMGLSESELTALASEGVLITERTMDERTAGMIRHVLTSVGGLMVMMGYTDDATVLAVTGAAMTLLGFIWSYMAKA
jgi:archaeosine-15-forming tRNA-guanine transglycosylase